MKSGEPFHIWLNLLHRSWDWISCCWEEQIRWFQPSNCCETKRNGRSESNDEKCVVIADYLNSPKQNLKTLQRASTNLKPYGNLWKARYKGVEQNLNKKLVKMASSTTILKPATLHPAFASMPKPEIQTSRINGKCCYQELLCRNVKYS